MDAWQRHVHHASKKVIEATGACVVPTNGKAQCCGALALHAGMAEHAQQTARNVIEALSGDVRPILVNSAGCGAMLKDYGNLLNTDEAHQFSTRVFDIHEWLLPKTSSLIEQQSAQISLSRSKVAIQDPCHMRHVQRNHDAVHQLLEPFVELVPLNDDGLCCGAGGAFSVLEPELASQIRDVKVAAVKSSGAQVVASANPGCSLHLANAGLDVVHPCELLSEALDVT